MKAAILVGWLVAATAAAAEPATGAITVEVKTKSDKGLVRCALWKDSAGFPGEVKTKASTVRVLAPSITKGKATCVFPDVPAAKYVITILHDLNSNDELDTNKIGIPKEPLGFSNGARILFGPPDYDDAEFAFDGADTTIAIKVH